LLPIVIGERSQCRVGQIALKKLPAQVKRFVKARGVLTLRDRKIQTRQKDDKEQVNRRRE
jgi:hypothetical protein